MPALFVVPVLFAVPAALFMSSFIPLTLSTLSVVLPAVVLVPVPPLVPLEFVVEPVVLLPEEAALPLSYVPLVLLQAKTNSERIAIAIIKIFFIPSPPSHCTGRKTETNNIAVRARSRQRVRCRSAAFRRAESSASLPGSLRGFCRGRPAPLGRNRGWRSAERTSSSMLGRVGGGAAAGAAAT